MAYMLADQSGAYNAYRVRLVPKQAWKFSLYRQSRGFAAPGARGR